MKTKTKKLLKEMTKQERYKYNMKAAGFNQRAFWVHDDDLKAVRAYVKRKRKARIDSQ